MKETPDTGLPLLTRLVRVSRGSFSRSYTMADLLFIRRMTQAADPGISTPVALSLRRSLRSLLLVAGPGDRRPR